MAGPSTTTPKKKRKGPPAPVKLTCATCGRAFAFDPRVGGRRPKYCEEHRRRPNQERAELALQLRRQRERRDLRDQAQGAAAAGQVARLAAGLSVVPDLEQAARLFGVVAGKGGDLGELERAARTLYPKLVAGRDDVTAQLGRAAANALLVDLLERRAELPARDLASAIKVAAGLAQDFAPDGPQHNYTSFTVQLLPPPADGQLTPEQRARAQGLEREPTPEEAPEPEADDAG